MHGAGVQGVLPAFDSQETRALLEGLVAQTGHLPQILTGGQVSVGDAIRHDVPCQRFTPAGISMTLPGVIGTAGLPHS